MSHLIQLREQLRPVAREVFLHDPYFEHIDCINTNKHARIYLRRIIQRAQNPPFDLRISNRQLARLIGSSRTSIFLQWFRYNVRLPAEFRRARWFLREMILLSIREDRRLSDGSTDLNVEENPIQWPSKRTIAKWKQIAKPIREAHRIEGPPIKNEADALETLGWMQDAFIKHKSSGSFSSSSSYEDDIESNNFGEDAHDERKTGEEISDESRGLNGHPDIIINQQLSDELSKKLGISNQPNDITDDNEASFSDEYNLLNQRLCFEDNGSKYGE